VLLLATDTSWETLLLPAFLALFSASFVALLPKVARIAALVAHIYV
jgi:hypothetical protein